MANGMSPVGSITPALGQALSMMGQPGMMGGIDQFGGMGAMGGMGGMGMGGMAPQRQQADMLQLPMRINAYRNAGMHRFSPGGDNKGLSIPGVMHQPRAYTPQSVGQYRPQMATQSAIQGLLALRQREPQQPYQQPYQPSYQDNVIGGM